MKRLIALLLTLTISCFPLESVAESEKTEQWIYLHFLTLSIEAPLEMLPTETYTVTVTILAGRNIWFSYLSITGHLKVAIYEGQRLILEQNLVSPSVSWPEKHSESRTFRFTPKAGETYYIFISTLYFYETGKTLVERDFQLSAVKILLGKCRETTYDQLKNDYIQLKMEGEGQRAQYMLAIIVLGVFLAGTFGLLMKERVGNRRN